MAGSIHWKRCANTVRGKAFFTLEPTHGLEDCGQIVYRAGDHWHCGRHGKLRKVTAEDLNRVQRAKDVVLGEKR